MNQQVTIFKSIQETQTPFYRSLGFVIERIKDGSSKDLVSDIRSEKDKSLRNELKKKLPAICFSGIFTKRNDASIQEHSGLICLDFDGYQSDKLMYEDKKRFTKDKYVLSVFMSPSGNGLKVLVQIPQDVDNHVNYFNSLEQHFNSPYFDVTSKNVSRVCYESYDPNIYINWGAEVWDTIIDKDYKMVDKNRPPLRIPMSDENKIVDIIVKWWQKNYPMIEGQRNHNTYILAAAFNEFGINKGMASYILGNYQDKGFGEEEIKRTIESAYSDVSKFGTKYFEDTDKFNNVKLKLRTGTSKEEMVEKLRDDGVDDDVIGDVMNFIEKENEKKHFWAKNDKGVVNVVPVLFKQFLEDNGYYKYTPEDSSTSVFVRVTNNLVDKADENEMKDFVLNYLLELNDLSIYNYFASATKLFKEDFLSLLSTIEILFVADEKDSSYLYYQNCAVKIKKDEIIMIDYLDLGGYVWKDQVINRIYRPCEVSEGFEYRRFIHNICHQDMDRINAVESTIGFLMHGYKNLGYCPAVILNDEVVNDNPEGGTGKGIFVNALGHMKKVVTLDSKIFSFDKSFLYQLVSTDTQILCFDDAVKNFNFERLFSVITEGITIEKKNKDAFRIPFKRSPKVIITTNYAIKGVGNSFERRKFELEFHQYYSMNFTPLDEFKRLLFGDWNDDDWCQFDNYMIGCLIGYLNTGLVKSKFVNLNTRHLLAETSYDFLEWAGVIDGDINPEVAPDKRINTYECYNRFVLDYPDYAPRAKMTISISTFNKWLDAFVKYMTGDHPRKGRDARGKWIIWNEK